MRKRLVVCCDGTWLTSDSLRVSNVEKFARCVKNEPDVDDAGEWVQIVHYVAGIGTATGGVGRLWSAAFGTGLLANLVSAYRFLALNYDPGDEIYIVGFSRGAYTARSLAGMIERVGLLTPEAVVGNQLRRALILYRSRGVVGRRRTSTIRRFRDRYCHPGVDITFLGVFDTVGGLGVPFPSVVQRRYRFHDVTLGDSVLVARQALALDEGRYRFRPCLWESPADAGPVSPERVRQVWFRGDHSDIGGGHAETALSNTTLRWMVAEAEKVGLAFNPRLLELSLQDTETVVPLRTLGRPYRLINAVVRWSTRLAGRRNDRFDGDRRVLEVRPRDVNVYLARPAQESWTADARYHAAAANIARWWTAFPDEASRSLRIEVVPD